MKKLQGWTLIETMLVVALLGLLASIAYPSYQAHILRARRADAQIALQALRWAQEQYRAAQASYATAQALGYPRDSDQGFYRVTVVQVQAHGFRASAAPQGVQVADTDCGEQQLQMTEQGPDLSDAAKRLCWGAAR